MLTESEKKEIVKEVLLAVLLKMPEVIGNLMTHHSLVNDVREKLYRDYPEFRGHGPVVASCIEEIDGSDLKQSVDDVIKRAVPVIRERIKVVKASDLVSKPSKTDLDLTIDTSHGAI